MVKPESVVAVEGRGFIMNLGITALGGGTEHAQGIERSRGSTRGGSAAHVREWKTPVVRAEVGEHLRLDLRGVRVVGDPPADD